MRVLITAGPTREPLDPVRYLGNRSSGKMGLAIVNALLEAGHEVTAVVGPTDIAWPAGAKVVRVETAREMYEAVLREWSARASDTPRLLIMAAAVADYRPKTVAPVKMSRAAGVISIELEPTEDIAAAACARRATGQVVVGFSLEREGDVERAVKKMKTKGLDMIVFNPLATMGAEDVVPMLLYPDGRAERLERVGKTDFARVLVERSAAIVGERAEAAGLG